MNKKRGKINISFMKNKKGLSSVVIALILIVISLVAIGVVWFVVQNLINQSSKQIDGISGLTINLDIVNAYLQSQQIVVDVKRTVGSGNLAKIKFILFDGTNSELLIQNSTLQELEENNFLLLPTKLASSSIVSVSVAPVFKTSDGTETTGSVTDTFYLANGHVPTGTSGYCGDGTCDPGETGTNCPQDCAPSNEDCLSLCAQFGVECGSNPNTYCSGVCGICSGSTPDCTKNEFLPIVTAGKCVQCLIDSECDVSKYKGCTNGVCVPLDCVETPERITAACGSRVCGTVIGACGDVVSCGTCGARQLCVTGTCTLVTPINNGTVEDVFPPSDNGEYYYFGSSDLPTDLNTNYELNYIKFPNNPIETDCSVIAVFRLPIQGGYTKSHIGFNFAVPVNVGEEYDIFNSLEECQAY
ncbi:Uncharacterised protein [uncultured archaeon]|nr:Uncharacterised protein [uncultured archaeon]